MARCGNLSDSCKVTFAEPEKRLIEIYLYGTHGDPLEGAELFCNQKRVCVTDHLGYCFYQPIGTEPISFTVWKDGYRVIKGFFPITTETVIHKNLVLPVVADGFWWDKSIVIDPRSSQEDTIFSPREAERDDDNLQTALCLREILKLAGAKVTLTRETNVSPNQLAKVLKAESTKADILISIDHNGKPYLGYYFSSRKGKLLARSIKQVMEDSLSCKKVKLGESTAGMLVHTSMPAVVVNLSHQRCKQLPHDKEERAWREAQTLFRGFRTYFEQIAQ